MHLCLINLGGEPTYRSLETLQLNWGTRCRSRPLLLQRPATLRNDCQTEAPSQTRPPS